MNVSVRRLCAWVQSWVEIQSPAGDSQLAALR